MLNSIGIIISPPTFHLVEPAISCVSHDIGAVTRIGLLFLS